MSSIFLESSDQMHFCVKVEILMKSSVCRDMFYNFVHTPKSTSGKTEETVIPLPIQGSALLKVIQWLEHHKNDAVAMEVETEEEEIPEMFTLIKKKTEIKPVKEVEPIDPWDVELLTVEVDSRLLILITKAANYLGITELLETCCKVIANNLKGKSTVEMREILHVQNNLTPEEEANIRRERCWFRYK